VCAHVRVFVRMRVCVCVFVCACVRTCDPGGHALASGTRPLNGRAAVTIYCKGANTHTLTSTTHWPDLLTCTASSCITRTHPLDGRAAVTIHCKGAHIHPHPHLHNPLARPAAHMHRQLMHVAVFCVLCAVWDTDAPSGWACRSRGPPQSRAQRCPPCRAQSCSCCRPGRSPSRPACPQGPRSVVVVSIGVKHRGLG